MNKPLSQRLVALLVDILKDTTIFGPKDEKLKVADVHIDDQHGVIVYTKEEKNV